MESAATHSRAFNAQRQIIPKQRILCSNVTQVAQAIKLIVREGRPFAIRSTGHCFAGYSQHQDLVVDLSLMSDISLTADDTMVVCGPGTKANFLYSALAKKGRTLPGGTYVSVGTAGIATGGGLGYLARKQGLLCDWLRKIEMVTASGDIVQASKTENSDLFWALRGGGAGSFGVVTKLEFETIDLPRVTSINMQIVVSPGEAEQILYDWQDWNEQANRGLTTHLWVTRYDRNRILFHLKGISQMDRTDTVLVVQNLLGLKHQVRADHVVQEPISGCYMRLIGDHHHVTPLDAKLSSEFIAHTLPRSAVGSFVSTLMSYPSNSVQVTFEALGGAVADVADDATPYPHRSARFLAYFLSKMRNEEDRTVRLEAQNKLRGILKRYASGGIYMNYPERNIDNWQRRYWGGNLERLVEVKNKWDTKNVFNHRQSVPHSI